MSPNIRLVIEVAGATVLLAAALTLIFWGRSAERRIKRRLQQLREKRTNNAKSATAPMQLRRREVYSAIPGLDRLLKRYLPNRAALHTRLEQADLSLTVARYLAFNLGLLVVTTIALRLFKFPFVACLLFGVSVGIGLPHLFVSRRIKRRVSAFNNTFPEAIDLMVRGLRAGLPIIETIGVVSSEMPDPLSSEFRRIVHGLQIGQAFDETLLAAAKRIDSPEFRFFVVTLSIQRETGGNLAETLANLSDILRRRRQLYLKVRAVSSESRAGAWVIGLLPFAVGAVLFFLNPKYMMPLFTTHSGNMVLGAGLITFAVGVLIMAKMVSFEI